ncbi:hypothetical protein LMG27174_03407 [Paraburkholderia rhynchosiae]|uniref:Uncharacterized protein n=1 Tax=Paraburkholderia rhynchosiae TaxID=487049 RepID=A0A6J5B8I6_9BURK|nr:hypothetical protein LMG27174_03407 [Paraburkholderia rhynchosiae]
MKWAFHNGFDLDFGVGAERFNAYWARGEASTAWTTQSVNSNWGLLAISARRLGRAYDCRDTAPASERNRAGCEPRRFAARGAGCASSQYGGRLKRELLQCDATQRIPTPH